MADFGVLFVSALAAATATRLWLAGRQVKHVTAHRSGVPAQFAGEVSLAEHQKAADYTAAKTRFAAPTLTALKATFACRISLSDPSRPLKGPIACPQPPSILK